ncbi:uncharacterized protein LOC114294960 [Camellia sinensis]|uniref:uncharacterized protein LOC114294960 n=1 Tax=Camellia sinensis TaxID=4442 RepID=UPI001036C90D|nr:uncharacterized protein LOC114294960 [Camellia sinensis]
MAKAMSSDTANNAMEISSEEDEVIEDLMDFLMIAFMHDYINASTLFRSQRYHLQEFHGRHYSRPKELFNHRHSSLRNVIERTFGVLKKRFPILRSMPNYKSTRQGPLMIACCVVHNWIRLMAAEEEANGVVRHQSDYVDMSQHR